MRNDNMRKQEGNSKEEILFGTLSEGEKTKVKKKRDVYKRQEQSICFLRLFWM